MNLSQEIKTSAEIQTGHLPNTSMVRYRYSNFLVARLASTQTCTVPLHPTQHFVQKGPLRFNTIPIIFNKTTTRFQLQISFVRLRRVHCFILSNKQTKLCGKCDYTKARHWNAF